MRFHLDHQPSRPGFQLSHTDKIFMIGSCFSDNIGHLLHEHSFQLYNNPNGILFNPFSIAGALRAIIHVDPADEKNIFERDRVWFSFSHHSSFHADTKKELVDKINDENKKAFGFLKEASVLIITFGTASAYRHLGLNTVVANCHKQPTQDFEKFLAGPEKIINDYAGLLKELHEINPTLKIIFTVSPVKYLKDGLAENNLSKAALLLSVHSVVKDNLNCFYFPAYELVTDDLRDYRFYKEDLAHPNDLAIAYVWQKFSDWAFSEQTRHINEQVKKLKVALGHRKLIASSTDALKLNDYILRQRETIRSLNPGFEL